MTIRAHELARLLLAGPNVPVCTWQNQAVVPVEACDSDIEQVLRVLDPYGNPVVVLGMDISEGEFEGCEEVWTDRPGLAKAQGNVCAKGKVAV